MKPMLGRSLYPNITELIIFLEINRFISQIKSMIILV